MKKRMKRIVAIQITLILTMMMTVSALAAEIGNGKTDSSEATLTIPKGVTVKNAAEGELPGPSITYIYTIEPVTPHEGATVTNGVVHLVEKGPIGGATLGNDGKVVFTDALITGVNNGGKETTKDIVVNIDISKFTKPGIYRYKITDTTTTETLYNAGITRPDGYATERYLDVYIKYNSAGTNLIVGGYTLTKQNVEAADNNYKDRGYVADSEAVTGAAGTDVYRTYNINIYKAVSGSMGDKTYDFQFAYTVQNYGLRYRPGKYMSAYVTTESTGSFTLHDGESYSIRGLSPRATVTYTETNDTDDIYQVTIDGRSNSTVEWENLVQEAQKQKKEMAILAVGNISDYSTVNSTTSVNNEGSTTNYTNVRYTNSLGDVSPTGIALRFAPFILMLGFAVVLLMVVRRRKHQRVDVRVL